ncbi:MAG: virulence RhuM family protein [Woeseiaceae bacterium]
MVKDITTQDQLTEFLLYNTADGGVKVEIFLYNENIWLPQKRIAELFGKSRKTIGEHLKNIFNEGELDENSVCRNFRHTADDGKNYNTKYYNLDAILSVGYRVNSSQATQFRIWATQILKEYIIKGFAMDDDRLKNGQFFGKDYFKELLERVRSIRASERRIYQQITDIFAECCVDYDGQSETANLFYANVQNKFHYAITGHTAAEIVYQRVDAQQEKSGMLSYKNAPKGRVLKSDVVIAKNYLKEDEIKKLDRTVSSYFDYIENQIEQHNTLSMDAFSQSVNKFLSFNDFKILDGFGSVTQQQAKTKAYQEYEKFNKTQKINSDFDKLTKKLKK